MLEQQFREDTHVEKYKWRRLSLTQRWVIISPEKVISGVEMVYPVKNTPQKPDGEWGGYAPFCANPGPLQTREPAGQKGKAFAFSPE